MRWLLFLVLALLLVLCVYIAYQPFKKNAIPRTIWTYWHDARDIPNIVQKCIDTWQINNPQYKIIVLDIDKIKNLFRKAELKTIFPNIDLDDLNKQKNHARVADYARVMVLYKFGGTWMDSSIICTQSLDWVQKIHKQTQSELIGFYSPHTRNKKFPILENWFFSCIPKSTFVHDWIAEIRFMSSFQKEEDYVTHIKSINAIDIQGLDEMLPYLVMHLCATVVQQKNPSKYKLYLTDARLGPFKYLEENRWELPKSFEALCTNKSLQAPLIKMRGTERNFLLENKLLCNSENKHIKYVVNNSEQRS
jgi:hypothetical protein